MKTKTKTKIKRKRDDIRIDAETKCRIVRSYHHATEGIWLEFPPYSDLAPGYDFVVWKNL